MRLIDADALKRKVLEWMPPDPCGREEKEYPFETDIVVSLIREIEEAPTIEALEQVPSEDCISRKAAIDVLDTGLWGVEWDKALAIAMLKDLPSAEKKRGKWIVYPLMDEGRVELECPICGDTFIRAVDYKPHFCENCGADMRGDEE